VCGFRFENATVLTATLAAAAPAIFTSSMNENVDSNRLN